MKQIALLICFLSSFGQLKADTVDVCHVFYNKKKIAELFYYGPLVLKLKLDTVKKKDEISVNYGDDTPCHECASSLAVYNQKNEKIFTFYENGLGKLLTIPLAAFIEPEQPKGKYLVYYIEDNVFPDKKRFVFELKIE
jgi:hypothetical protein